MFSKLHFTLHTFYNYCRYAYVNALSYANTTDADTLLLKKVMSQEIPNQEAAAVFSVWGADKVPTTPVLDYMSVSVTDQNTAQ